MSSHEDMPSEDEINDISDSEIAADEIEDDDELGMDMDMGMDLGALLTTEDGDTVCSALVDAAGGIAEVAKQLATQNKILIKMLAKLT